jgi:hypothetical protein
MTTQESFQQSLVEIGSVVSEEKIFFLISSPFFSWMEGGAVGHNFEMGLPKDYPCQV